MRLSACVFKCERPRRSEAVRSQKDKRRVKSAMSGGALDPFERSLSDHKRAYLFYLLKSCRHFLHTFSPGKECIYKKVRADVRHFLLEGYYETSVVVLCDIHVPKLQNRNFDFVFPHLQIFESMLFVELSLNQ